VAILQCCRSLQVTGSGRLLEPHRLRLFVLPAYSPQLNPDEWVWKNVKHDRVGRTSVTGPQQSKAKVISALRRLQKMPALVRAFFSDPDLRYITA
jgi:transposase